MFIQSFTVVGAAAAVPTGARPAGTSPRDPSADVTTNNVVATTSAARSRSRSLRRDPPGGVVVAVVPVSGVTRDHPRVAVPLALCPSELAQWRHCGVSCRWSGVTRRPAWLRDHAKPGSAGGVLSSRYNPFVEK
jgi:hypothetical protein